MKCGSKTKERFAKEVAGELPSKITYWHPTRFKLPGMSVDDTLAAVHAIFRVAQLYVPVKFDRIDVQKKALIKISIGPKEEFDKEGNILAMADVISLRDPASRDLWFSPFVNWGEGPVSDQVINPIPVGAHELGHTLGFGHNKEHGLMYPTIQPLVTTPTEQEMGEFWKAYPEWTPKG